MSLSSKCNKVPGGAAGILSHAAFLTVCLTQMWNCSFYSHCDITVVWDQEVFTSIFKGIVRDLAKFAYCHNPCSHLRRYIHLLYQPLLFWGHALRWRSRSSSFKAQQIHNPTFLKRLTWSYSLSSSPKHVKRLRSLSTALSVVWFQTNGVAPTVFFVYFEMIKLAGGGARAATASVSEATRAEDKRIPTSIPMMPMWPFRQSREWGQ